MFSLNATTRPAVWWASRNGTSFRTRYSARSVASMSGVTAASIFLGWMVRVVRTRVAMVMLSLIVLRHSSIDSVLSCRSLL